MPAGACYDRRARTRVVTAALPLQARHAAVHRCILAELLLKRPPFQGDVEKTQLEKICRVLGVPTEETWPGVLSLPHAQVGSSTPHASDRSVGTPRPRLLGHRRGGERPGNRSVEHRAGMA